MGRNLENWLTSYIEYTKYLEAPDQFHLWTAIGAVGGALRGKCWIDMGYFKWKPNFFIVLVAPPGVVSKSTTLGVGMELLREVDGIHFGPDSSTWQAITESFLESEVVVPNVGQMSCITIAASELGTFLDPKNREMLDVLCDLWDGRNVPWRRRTKGEGLSEIHNPWLNFLGCTTPGWLQENFPVVAIRGGFASRTVFVYGEKKRQLIAYPKLEIESSGDNDRKKLRLFLVNDLKRIALLQGEFRLTAGALEYGKKWYGDHWTGGTRGLDPETFGGYIARKQTHIHKTAMVVSAAQRDDMSINEMDLMLAEHLVTMLEKDMQEVFASVGDDKVAQAMNHILRTVRHYPKGIKRDELVNQCISRMGIKMFDEAIAGLVQSNRLVLRTSNLGVIVRLGDNSQPFQHTEEQTPVPSESPASSTSSDESVRASSG